MIDYCGDSFVLSKELSDSVEQIPWKQILRNAVDCYNRKAFVYGYNKIDPQYSLVVGPANEHEAANLLVDSWGEDYIEEVHAGIRDVAVEAALDDLIEL